MIADLTAPWHWTILPGLVQTAFAPVPDIPLPIWASKHVFLSRKITSKPGFYDPEEFPWTWEFQEILRTRRAAMIAHPADGALCLCDPETPGATVFSVQRESVLKSSVTGFTEGSLNAIRFLAKHDPQNVIFSIDSAKEAANINENRLQPTLRQLGEEIFTSDDDDVGRFLLSLKRMLVYFLGSYSEAAFANKFAELGIGDELEEHGDPNTIENLESRLKSALNPMLALLSKPKLAGGPIDLEYGKGTMCVYEIPCPACGFYQQLLQENKAFDHWRDLLGEWNFSHERDPYFRCLNPECKKPIEEHWKRWFNDRSRRRWRITNPNPEPGHVSFHISDFYGYHPDANWRKLGVKYIQSKGDPVARQAYRNHHEGLPWEVRATKTEAEDILALREPYKRGTIPWKPYCLLLGADVGLTYVKWTVDAFQRDGTMAAIDYGTALSPDDLIKILQRDYPCVADGQRYPIALGFCDTKYRKDDVQKACLRSAKKLWPTAGIGADLTTRTISLNHVPSTPKWFGVIVFVDRDAKSDLYEHGISAWVDWERRLQHLPHDDERRKKPEYPRVCFFEDLRKDDEFLKEHTTERLVELTSKDKGWMPHAAKQFTWKRKGPNHFGDATKGARVGFRYLTKSDPAG